jgi:hypothetical protein
MRWLPLIAAFVLWSSSAAAEGPVASSQVNEDKLTLCPLITPELQRKIVSDHANSGVCQTSCSGCGCKGGPGYRGPDKKCVGYANIIQVCGPPPHSNCVRECAIVRDGCIGRAWLKGFAAIVGLTVTFIASERFPLVETASPLPPK